MARTYVYGSKTKISTTTRKARRYGRHTRLAPKISRAQRRQRSANKIRRNRQYRRMARCQVRAYMRQIGSKEQEVGLKDKPHENETSSRKVKSTLLAGI